MGRGRGGGGGEGGTVGLEGAFRSSPRKNGDTPLPGLTKTQVDKHAKMRLVHCLAHEETRKLLEDSGLAATRLQLDSKWNNMQAMWTQIKELFHDANFNPQLVCGDETRAILSHGTTVR